MREMLTLLRSGPLCRGEIRATGDWETGKRGKGDWETNDVRTGTRVVECPQVQCAQDGVAFPRFVLCSGLGRDCSFTTTHTTHDQTE